MLEFIRCSDFSFNAVPAFVLYTDLVIDGVAIHYSHLPNNRASIKFLSFLEVIFPNTAHARIFPRKISNLLWLFFFLAWKQSNLINLWTFKDRRVYGHPWKRNNVHPSAIIRQLRVWFCVSGLTFLALYLYSVAYTTYLLQYFYCVFSCALVRHWCHSQKCGVLYYWYSHFLNKHCATINFDIMVEGIYVWLTNCTLFLTPFPIFWWLNHVSVTTCKPNMSRQSLRKNNCGATFIRKVRVVAS